MREEQSNELRKVIHVPLTVALVSLLTRLPCGNLQSHLPQIVLRLVDHLRPNKDNNPELRKEALAAICRIVKMLRGGRVFDNVLVTIAHQLNKGYACHQVRLHVLDRLLFEVEKGARGGLWSFRSGDFDLVGRLLTRLYLDEMVGQLAEEIDNRRAAGHSLTSTSNRKNIDPHALTQEDLSAMDSNDLPEARGLKAPDGLARLCRMLSTQGLCQMFEDLTRAVWNASSGDALQSNNSDEHVEQRKEKYGKSAEMLGCGLRYRKRALARLETAIQRLGTRAGLLCPPQQQLSRVDPREIFQLSVQIVKKNLSDCVAQEALQDLPKWAVDQDQKVPKIKVREHVVPAGWGPCRSAPLEPKWDYLGIPPEPKREASLVAKAQSSNSQSFLLVSLALNAIYGLLDAHHSEELQQTLRLATVALRSNLIRVINGGVKCLHKIFLITTSEIPFRRSHQKHRKIPIGRFASWKLRLAYFKIPAIKF
ncbi:hypothetical protein Ciccas_003634 [Cichlidogyrus casuarinus]|uniref:U3 small nucleolar RNA-associated protein 20 domain-containing protein n=1 Tax=Cichlidogyrus casuarinus TaxID=1844966 RepID=A0ABD2QDS1_9PLAT